VPRARGKDSLRSDSWPTSFLSSNRIELSPSKIGHRCHRAARAWSRRGPAIPKRARELAKRELDEGSPPSPTSLFYLSTPRRSSILACTRECTVAPTLSPLPPGVREGDRPEKEDRGSREISFERARARTRERERERKSSVVSPPFSSLFPAPAFASVAPSRTPVNSS